MKRIRAYKYRLYPNAKQKELLAKHFGCARWVYNYGLAKKIEYYKQHEKSYSRYDLQKDLVVLKKQEDTQWLSDVCAQSLQVVLKNLDAAYTSFFRKKNSFPKFKRRRNRQSVAFPQNTKIDFDNNRIQVIKFIKDGGIKCKFHRRFEGIIKTTTISKTPTDKYYVSILVEEDVKSVKQKPLKIDSAIGIDLGIKDLLITSDGNKYENPNWLKKSLSKLAREQRRLSRKIKKSNNYVKQRKRVAIVHEKISNQRKDFLHKISRQLVDENQINTYCFEDLSVKNMMGNHNLAQAISNVSWSMFVQFLSYKADWAGKNILKIGRFDPSSKMCNSCGYINNELTLNDRTWTCKSCNARHDRDINAAKNIRDFAFDKQNLIGSERSELKPVGEGGLPPSLNQEAPSFR